MVLYDREQEMRVMKLPECLVNQFFYDVEKDSDMDEDDNLKVYFHNRLKSNILLTYVMNE